MFNLNDPKLTKQEKDFMLSLQIDKDLKSKVEEAKTEGKNFCFSSYWIVTMIDLIDFNKGAHQIDTCFDFEKDGLELYYPETQCVLYEGERVEIGEWDKTYERWSSHSYQRVGVLFLNGAVDITENPANPLEDFTYYDCSLKRENIDWDKLTEEKKQEVEDLFFKYPLTFGEKATNRGFGIIDIPLHMLERYEDRRFYHPQFLTSATYEELFKKQLKDRNDYWKGVKANKKKLSSFRKSNRKQTDFKSFGGGFGK